MRTLIITTVIAVTTAFSIGAQALEPETVVTRSDFAAISDEVEALPEVERAEARRLLSQARDDLADAEDGRARLAFNKAVALINSSQPAPDRATAER